MVFRYSDNPRLLYYLRGAFILSKMIADEEIKVTIAEDVEIVKEKKTAKKAVRKPVQKTTVKKKVKK